ASSIVTLDESAGTQRAEMKIFRHGLTGAHQRVETVARVQRPESGPAYGIPVNSAVAAPDVVAIVWSVDDGGCWRRRNCRTAVNSRVKESNRAVVPLVVESVVAITIRRASISVPTCGPVRPCIQTFR